jgi:hypothetical protein
VLTALQKSALPRLFSLVHRLRDNHGVDAGLCLQIQEELILRISRAERRISLLRNKNSYLKKELSTRQERHRSRRLKTKLETNGERIYQQRQLCSIYRDIGDSLAFIYIDRWDIKPLVFREPAGFITGKRGSRLERLCMRAIFKKAGAIAILNDLTHSLRYSDLTVMGEGGTFMLMEIKSGRGGKHSRTKRQVAAASRVMEYLTEDKIQGLYQPETLMLRRAVNTEPSYNTKAINRLIRETGVDSWTREEVEPGLRYLVISGEPSANMDEILGPASGKRLVMFVNNFKYSKYAYYPFILSFDDPESIVRFYEGDISVIVMVDLEFVAARLRSVNIDFRVTSDDEWPWELNQGPEAILSRLSWHFISRLGAEFLSLDWFVNQITERLQPETLAQMSH